MEKQSALDLRLMEIAEITGREPSSAVRTILERARDCLSMDGPTDLEALKTATLLERQAFDLACKEAQTAKTKPAAGPDLGALGRKTNT